MTTSAARDVAAQAVRPRDQRGRLVVAASLRLIAARVRGMRAAAHPRARAAGWRTRRRPSAGWRCHVLAAQRQPRPAAYRFRDLASSSPSA